MSDLSCCHCCQAVIQLVCSCMFLFCTLHEDAEGCVVPCIDLLPDLCLVHQNIPAKETPIVMLSEITELEMRTLIEFMYCGEATIDQSQLEALLKVSECRKESICNIFA